jgi:hypothetical protein
MVENCDEDQEGCRTMTSLRTQWESFWQQLPEETGAALWDSAPEFTAARHLPLFEPHFDPDLPLLDLGCGNSTQSLFFATKFPRVIGIDIAGSAISSARRNNAAPNIEFRVMDLLDAEAVAELHDQVGDVNVYMRAVVHQLPWIQRWPAVAALSELIGSRGHLFNHELTSATTDAVAGLLNAPGGAPPKVHRLFTHFRFGERGGAPTPQSSKTCFATLDSTSSRRTRSCCTPLKRCRPACHSTCPPTTSSHVPSEMPQLRKTVDKKPRSTGAEGTRRAVVPAHRLHP